MHGLYYLIKINTLTETLNGSPMKFEYTDPVI